MLTIAKEGQERKRDFEFSTLFFHLQCFDLSLKKKMFLVEMSIFLEKLNDLCELQFTSQEYIPLTLDRDVLQTLTLEEVTSNLIENEG